jgi:predicted esterase
MRPWNWALPLLALSVLLSAQVNRLSASRGIVTREPDLGQASTVSARQGVSPPAGTVERAFQEYWAASDQAAALKRVEAVVKSGVSLEEAVARLRRGRDYSINVSGGELQGHHRTSDGVEHSYTFVIPKRYDPSRQYPLRVQLHGGVARVQPPPTERRGVGRLPPNLDEIEAFPAAWVHSLWWQASQVENLAKVVDAIKRAYNVDENRVYLTGISDGGTGAYFVAFRDTTLWSSFLPLIGSMMVLANPEVGADGELFPGNAVNKPFFVVNGGRDRLYPAGVVQPYVEHLMKLGGDVVFHIKPAADHNTEWWPEERADFEAFVDDHPRDPLPDRLSWETERTDRYNRAHWLVIDRLGDVPGQSALPDSNLLHRGLEYDFGLRITSADRGRRIGEIVPDSGAASMGLRAGDVIVEMDRVPVQSAREIFGHMQEWTIGSTVHVTVERGGQRQSLAGLFAPHTVEVPPEPIFPRRRPSGRVDLVRRGNVVEVMTRGVKAFTLLLSPSKFDFARPVRVSANGRTVFEGRVDPSLSTLMKWAARDNDRTMLFGAELPIDLTKQ